MVKNSFRYLILLLSFLFCAGTQAQVAESGVVEFQITYPNPAPEIEKDIDALPQKMTALFYKDKIRFELQTLVGTTVILSDKGTGKTFVLTELMGKKIAIQSTSENIQKLDSENNQKNNTTFTLTKKTKKIAGYKCKQIDVSTVVDGTTYNFSYYVTDKLPDISFTIGSTDKNLQGFMLQYDMITNGMQLRLTAQKVELKKVDEALFVVPPEYQIITQH